MKKILLTASAIAFACSVQAAEISPYVGVKFGTSRVDVGGETDKNFVGYLAGGLKFRDVRGELEYSYLSQSEYFDGIAKVDMQRLMANIYYDIPYSFENVNPYVNAGVGNTFYDIDVLGFKDDGNAFTWSVGLGVSIAVLKGWNVDLGYRYVVTSDFEFYGIKIGDAKTHEGYVGLRYQF